MEPERSTAIVRKARDSALILNQKNPPHDNTHCVFDINISSIHKTSRCPLRKVLPTLIVYILHNWPINKETLIKKHYKAFAKFTKQIDKIKEMN